jgi:hypothetical protein
MAEKKQQVQSVKEWEWRDLDTNWGAQSSAILDLGGDKPIKGLALNMSTSGAVTFLAQVDGSEYDVLASDGTQLSIDTAGLTENFRFYPEFGPLRHVKAVCATSQVGATIKGVFAS